MTLAISMLNNLFPLHIKPQNIISSIPMCYAKCQNVKLHYEKLLMSTKNTNLVINGHDTMRPLGIQFKSFANSVCDTKYLK